MCPFSDMFDMYTPYDGEFVFMGNNVECKSISKGTVNLMMHDGIVRTLTDIMHVPNLKRNLISLGTLDSKGCKFSAISGVIKVVKGVMIVMKGEKVKNLYTLVGSIVKGGAGLKAKKG